ncbi:MAG: hypothetical protein LBD04_11050 [Synergistaceae bacterium]|nr:hypothetical protein [Synergistaceae bacterium]
MSTRDAANTQSRSNNGGEVLWRIVEECVVLDTFLKENVPENANAVWYFGEGVRTYLSLANVLVLAPDGSPRAGASRKSL